VSLFRLDCDPPAHSGTATCLTANGNFYLLTAAHVWKVLQTCDFALALEPERLLIRVEREAAFARMPSGAGGPAWGPDLSLVRIPIQIAKEIKEVKAFYNFERARRRPKPPRGCIGLSLWAVLGAPD